MKNDVFISYSTMDKHTADAICSTLENSGIRCWIAPRDIIPGSDWAQSIINAIKSSKIMVLVFSRNSNESSQVSKELNLAVSNNLIVMPFKIDDCMPSGNMEYFLADTHWLDAINGDMQAQINKLKNYIASMLAKIASEAEANNGGADNSSNANAGNAGAVNNGNNSSFNSGNNSNTNTNNYNNSSSNNGNNTAGGNDVEKAQNSVKPVGFLKAYGLLWQNTFDFKGCASRSEFWKAFGMNIVVWIAALFINVFVYSSEPVIILLYTFATILPLSSLSVRRLHDSNHRGYWLLLALTGYGSIVPFVFFFFESKYEGNKFRNN